MSLFRQLEKLSRRAPFPREDFITEIVVQVLKNSRELTMEWLRWLKVTEIRDVNCIKIESQVAFEKLAGHETDSRPDMVITLTENEHTEVIFVESKVGSAQGQTQLQRYVDHLNNLRKSGGLRKTSLIFITRDYESAFVDLKVPDSSIAFQTTRWFEFYNKLKAHFKKNSDGLSKQLMLFMEENGMSLGKQFRSTDLVALENFLSVKALMDETLGGVVKKSLWEICGEVSSLKLDADKQMREHNRYVIYARECLVGYYLPHENPDEPVWVGVELWSDPRSNTRKEEIRAFNDWRMRPGNTWDIFVKEEWICIRIRRPLHSLMAGDDHVQAVKSFLLDSLESVRKFNESNPKLPWAKPAA